jgi:hypothetical protein
MTCALSTEDFRYRSLSESTPVLLRRLAATIQLSCWTPPEKSRGGTTRCGFLPSASAFPESIFFPWLHKLVPKGFGDMIPGREVRTLPFRDSQGQVWKIGVAICYEDILPQHLRETGALHPQLVVNLTNDTWFGAKTEPWQHLALAVFGSVEQRTSLARAVNSGVSAFVDPNGRVLKKTYAVDPHLNPTPADMTMDVLPLLEGGHTVYESSGNSFAYLCLCATAFRLAPSSKAGRTDQPANFVSAGPFAAIPDETTGLIPAKWRNGRQGNNYS